MNTDNEKYMQIAIDLAEKSAQGGGGPFGAIVVKDNKIIGRGTNQVTSWNDPTAHAEVVAIRDACKSTNSFQLEGCVIYTSCEPCPMCLSAIYWARPEAIYYGGTKEDARDVGFDDAFIYQEIAKNSNERVIPSYHILHKESQKPFTIWRKKEDRIDY